MKNFQNKINFISQTIMNYFLFIFLGLGLALLIGIIYVLAIIEYSSFLSIEDFRKLISTYIPPIGILLASQIAGFAVIRTINNTNNIEMKKKKEEAKKSKKILEAYFRHLQTLGNYQIQSLTELKGFINNPSYQTISLTKMNIDKTFYDDNTNIIVFLNPIESMLNPDLHKYMTPEIIDYILKLKQKVIEMMQTMKVLKGIHIPNNNKQEVTKLIDLMKIDTQQILNESTIIMGEISKGI